jgi:uncharacterized protein (DUF58 family)
VAARRVRDSRPLRAIPGVGLFVRWHEERLTARGQYLLWTALALGLMGADTRRSQVYVLFAVAAATILAAVLATAFRRPRARLDLVMPSRATAQTPLVLRGRVWADGAPRDHLRISIPRPLRWSSSLAIRPREAFVSAVTEAPTEVQFELHPLRRGRYVLRAPTLRVTDPLALAAGPAAKGGERVLLVYPRFYTLEAFAIPSGRRYQPGGIPLSSSTGDAIEFVGTREYRDGDPVRNIHWRSWARRGEPVVKEYHEEYFARIALVLDSFAPPRPAPGQERAFEAAISVLASIADHYSRSEYVVDILAAGPEVYDVSSGRSLAYFDNILDVLAGLEPCHESSFAVLGPTLFEKLARITTVVAVLQDWDEPRERFLREVKALGTGVSVIIVRDEATTLPWAQAASLGQFSQMTADDVERRIASNPPSPRAQEARRA